MRTCGKFYQSASDIFLIITSSNPEVEGKRKDRFTRAANSKSERNELMNNLITINHKEQRVLTTQQLAEVYETDPNTITKNFNRNKDRYEEGKHYFVVEGEELQELKTTGQFVTD